MRFKAKIDYDGTDYSNALKQNKENFIKEHELQDDELAILLVYAIPTILTEQDVVSFMLLLDVYKRYLQIKELLDKQGLLVVSSTRNSYREQTLISREESSSAASNTIKKFWLHFRYTRWNGNNKTSRKY